MQLFSRSQSVNIFLSAFLVLYSETIYTLYIINTRYLHWTSLLVSTPVCSRLKAIGNSLALGPMFGGQMLHEVLKTDHSVVFLQGLELKILAIRDMHLFWLDREPYLLYNSLPNDLLNDMTEITKEMTL